MRGQPVLVVRQWHRSRMTARTHHRWWLPNLPVTVVPGARHERVHVRRGPRVPDVPGLPTRRVRRVWWCEMAEVGRRAAVVLSRDAVIPRRGALIAPCTTTIRNLPSEVFLEPGEDPVPLPSAVNLDAVEGVSIAILVERLDGWPRSACGVYAPSPSRSKARLRGSPVDAATGQDKQCWPSHRGAHDCDAARVEPMITVESLTRQFVRRASPPSTRSPSRPSLRRRRDRLPRSERRRQVHHDARDWSGLTVPTSARRLRDHQRRTVRRGGLRHAANPGLELGVLLDAIRPARRSHRQRDPDHCRNQQHQSLLAHSR